MTSFLNWLYNQANKVTQFFGSLYNTVINAAVNAYAWAREFTNEAYYNARSLIYSIRDSLRGTFDGLINQIRDYLISKYWEVRNWAEIQIAVVRQLAEKLYNYAIDQLTSRYWEVRNWVDIQIEVAKQLLQAVMDGKISLWDNRYNPLLYLSALKDKILALTSDNWFTRLKDLIETGYQNISTMANDPLAFVAAAIWPFFQSMLCYAIAYGMGTTKYTLPSIPNWSGGGSGSTYDGEIPTGSTGLARPLNSLYISGYIYNPSTGHYGVDYGLTMGATVRAAHDGVVISVKPGTSGYGNHIIIQSSEYWSLYAHLQSFKVSAGDQVKAGQAIAAGDSTGNSTGPHLHFELKVKGSYVNPVSWIN